MVCLFFVTEAEVVTEMCSPAAAGLKRFTFSQPDKLGPFNSLLFPCVFLIRKKADDLLRFQSCR